MDSLLKAASEFLSAVLAAIGFTGRPRRRAGIRQDLELLRELETFPDLGPGTWAHRTLTSRIELEVAKLADIDLPRRKVQWGSVVLAGLIGFPLAYVTYALNQDGFDWWSLIPGIISGLMLIAFLGLLFSPEEVTPGNNEPPGLPAAADTPGESGP